LTDTASKGTVPNQATREHLRRDLGLLQAASLAITDMIGIGPFITIPLILAAMGGPQALLGWILGAGLAFCDGLVWSELGAAMPEAGGSYHYLRRAYGPAGAGRWMSFLMVWQIMFSAPLSVASGSIGFANYLRYLVPSLANSISIFGWKLSGTVALGCAIPLLLVVLLYRPIRIVGNVSVIFLAGVLAGCLWIVGAGLPHWSAARVLDFPPGAFALNLAFGAALGHATLYALYSTWGYYNVCYLAGEIRDPGRVIPRAIVLSIITVGTLYVLMSVSILSVIPWREAMHSTFIAAAFIERLQGSWAARAITVITLWIALASVFSLLLGYSRIPYAAASDGNFFRVFARLHPRGGFPHIALITLGVTASLFGLLSLPEVIGSLVATRVLVQYLPQTIGFFILRFRAPNMPRPFRMWLYPLPGIVSILGWIWVLGTSARKSLLFAVTVFVLGSLSYWAMRRWTGKGGAG
jgi:APA family basic amino acid/polyamine antiporter